MRFRATITLLLCLAVGLTAAARTGDEPKSVLGVAGTCEEAKALLDLLRKDVGDDGVIVLVARSGEGETSRKINGQRLYAVWSYLHNAGKFPADRLVKAEGEKVRGRGRVELYAKGKLMLVLTAKRGGDIVGVKSCGSL